MDKEVAQPLIIVSDIVFIDLQGDYCFGEIIGQNKVSGVVVSYDVKYKGEVILVNAETFKQQH